MRDYYNLGKIWCSKRTPPFHTVFLFVICIIVYETDNNVAMHLPPKRDQEFYDYFGTAVSHVNRRHLLSNITALILFGTLVEIIHGTLSSIFIFWISAGTGVLAEMLLCDCYSSYMGASPGCYGLIGAYLSHILLNWNEAPLRLVWLIFLIFQSIEIAIIYSVDESYRNNTAHFSHLFGFLQGVFVGLVVLRNIKIWRWEVILQVFAFFASASLILIPSILISVNTNPI